MTAIDSDLDALLAGLDAHPEEWFAYLAVLHDYYLDRDDHEGAAACKWLIENEKKPVLTKAQQWVWWLATGDIRNQLTAVVLHRMDCVNGDVCTLLISPQLTGFIQVWKEGHRP